MDSSVLDQCTTFSSDSKGGREQNHPRSFETNPEEGAPFPTTFWDSIDPGNSGSSCASCSPLIATR